ncbi:hypothetical protein DPMN_026947 [Dreissena polymorpha]|uniref:Reverse transcriptase domain-containing protein n=1 Tax=Dreissena polymorpha TaxID=45954 RepID=A0A9D4RD72_DREPO|nr:hypothetical protein DPMN_026947 [Dreissena polymorpha]
MNAACIISETIYNTNSSDNLTLASLDAQKAFDTVDHNIMFNKLYHLGIQGHLWILLRNLYKNTSVKVKWDNLLSEKFLLQQARSKVINNLI